MFRHTIKTYFLLSDLADKKTIQYNADSLPEWRNWQTHQTQNLARVTPRGGSSPPSGTCESPKPLVSYSRGPIRKSAYSGNKGLPLMQVQQPAGQPLDPR